MIISVFDRVENIVGKASFPKASKGLIVWEWVNSLSNDKAFDLTKLQTYADGKL